MCSLHAPHLDSQNIISNIFEQILYCRRGRLCSTISFLFFPRIIRPGYAGDWTKIAEAMANGRSRTQCRSRAEAMWKNHLAVAKNSNSPEGARLDVVAGWGDQADMNIREV